VAVASLSCTSYKVSRLQLRQPSSVFLVFTGDLFATLSNKFYDMSSYRYTPGDEEFLSEAPSGPMESVHGKFKRF
jgi:hypothetical protein